MQTKTYYRPQPMTAGALYQVKGVHIAGFLCTVSGTVTITDADGTVMLSAFPLTAGQFVNIPMLFNTPDGGKVQLTTAAGTLLV